MVEPTNSYYEKVSEELEKIVHEVKDNPADDNVTSHPTDQSECYNNILYLNDANEMG